MSTPLSGSPTVGLGRFVKESRFSVPSHQRDYSWTEEHVSEFLRDIEEAVVSDQETYFCGLMVFTSLTPATFKVLDGQQRLATTLMLFSAVRNWLGGFSEYTKQHAQVAEYLGKEELGVPFEPKLSLTSANNDAFQRYITSSVPLGEMTKAVQKGKVDDRSVTLVKANIYVGKYVERRAEELGSPEAAIQHFIKLLVYLSDNVQIVRFVVGSDDVAYTIFETLNDRGKELSPLDLVKNYLFSRAEKYRKGSLVEFEGRWAEMMALLSSPKADSFLRAFWSARHGKPEGAKLFTAFKRVYSKPDALYQVSVEMRRDAERYAALFSSADPIWAEYNPKAKQSVDALTVIGLSQAHPIILAALERFDRREIERLLWLLECVAVRHQLVGRRRPGRVESLSGRAAKDITDKKITTATGVYTSIRELYVPDEDFQVAFESYEESSSRKIRYVLTGIERESIARDGSTLDDELTPSNVTVEHIFPKAPSADWNQVAASDPLWDSSFVSRLGNLCLLPGINHVLGNKCWAEKSSVYAKSRLNVTCKLSQYERWGREEIIKRQKHMAQLARTAWGFQ